MWDVSMSLLKLIAPITIVVHLIFVNNMGHWYEQCPHYLYYKRWWIFWYQIEKPIKDSRFMIPKSFIP